MCNWLHRSDDPQNTSVEAPSIATGPDRADDLADWIVEKPWQAFTLTLAEASYNTLSKPCAKAPLSTHGPAFQNSVRHFVLCMYHSTAMYSPSHVLQVLDTLL